MTRVLFLTKNEMVAGGVGEVMERLMAGLPGHGVTAVLACPGREALALYGGMGIAAHRAKMVDDWWKPLKRLKSIRRLVQIAKDERIDIVHAHEIGSPAEGALALKKSLGLPYVITSHGGINPAYRKLKGEFGFFKKRRIARQLESADAVTCLTSQMRGFIDLYAKIPEEKKITIANGFDLSWWRGGGEPQNRGGLPYAVALNRFAEGKGLELLIKAHASAVARGAAFSLVMAGDGPLKETLATLARSLGLPVFFGREEFEGCATPSVWFCGYLTGEPKRRVVRESLFMVHPSLFEAFGLTPLEGVAAQKTVAAFRLEAYADFLFDGENSILAEPGSAEGLSEAMEKIFFDEKLRQRGAELDLEISARFDWPAITRKYADLYAKILKRG